jgi:hypothetical protein
VVDFSWRRKRGATTTGGRVELSFADFVPTIPMVPSWKKAALFHVLLLVDLEIMMDPTFLQHATTCVAYCLLVKYTIIEAICKYI